jgi:hypothetical protein
VSYWKPYKKERKMNFAKRLVNLSGTGGEPNIINMKNKGRGELRYPLANGMNLNVSVFRSFSPNSF